MYLKDKMELAKMDKDFLTVTQVNDYINDVIKSNVYLQSICVVGEISNFKVSNGNAYFTLKDEFESQLQCVFWGITQSRYMPQSGDNVLIYGTLDYYSKGGKLTLIVGFMKPYGVGTQFEKFNALKSKLEKEGLFLEKIKKKLPEHIKRIGVATSESGAVIRDIIKVVTRRNPFVDIVLYPCLVQGDGAATEIIDAINYFELSNVDVVIVARGGGSLEDFSAFNDERVVRCVSQCNKPIVSAIGHETDFCLTDFAADLRASTPSVAGELVVKPLAEIVLEVARLLKNIDSIINEKLKNNINNFTINSYKANALAEKTIERTETFLANLIKRAKNGASDVLEKNSKKVVSLFETATDIAQSRLFDCENEFEKLMIKTDMLNPIKLLRSGYCKIFKNSHVVTSVSNVQIGDSVKAILNDGELILKVTKIGN